MARDCLGHTNENPMSCRTIPLEMQLIARADIATATLHARQWSARVHFHEIYVPGSNVHREMMEAGAHAVLQCPRSPAPVSESVFCLEERAAEQESVLLNVRTLLFQEPQTGSVL